MPICEAGLFSGIQFWLMTGSSPRHRSYKS